MVLPEVRPVTGLLLPFAQIFAQRRGLAISAVVGLGAAHGGTIGVDSREGEGSTFWVEIPRTAAATTQQESEVAA